MPKKIPINLAAALEVAGAEMPAPIVDAHRMRNLFADARPRSTPGYGAPTGDLVDDVIAAGPDRFDEALDVAAREYQRRAFLLAAGQSISHSLSALAGQAHASVADDLHATFAVAFDERARKLEKVAARLPAGANALEPEHVLAADARRAFIEASDLLDEMLTLAGGIEVTPPLVGGQRVLGGGVALLVNPGHVAQVVVHDLTDRPISSNDEVAAAEAVRRACKTYHADPRTFLVGMARAEYGGLHLAYAPSVSDLTERLEQVRRAHVLRVTRSASTAA
ncbi:hypothetical protein GCM10009809_08250 [Isoptericola hypogeus]|uniref:Uncharacterized protein n=1 Tax=Isoptericola hypogeus TaxID=300179 RepID=A0ABP4UZG1_9MICO